MSAGGEPGVSPEQHAGGKFPKAPLLSASSGNPTGTLGVSVFLTLLVIAAVMFTGFIFIALYIAMVSFTFFIVAFASAALFARWLKRRTGTVAVLGALLGWALSAPLGAATNTVINYVYEIQEPYEFVPATWLWAFIPLAVVLAVAAARKIMAVRANR
jgi:hypothetical protein